MRKKLIVGALGLLLMIGIVTAIQYPAAIKRTLVGGGQTTQSERMDTAQQATSATSNNSITKLTETWTYGMQSGLGGKDEMDGVAVDGTGNTFIGGPFEFTVDFNGTKRTAKAGTDIYVSKLDSSGKELWFISLDSGGNDFLWDLEADQNGDVFFSGGYGGSLTVNGKTYEAYRDGSALYAKLDGKTGKVLWIQTAGVKGGTPGLVNSPRTAGGNEIKVDSKGNAVAILSAAGDEYQIGGRTYKRAGVMDSFIVKISPDGKFVWTYQFLGTGRKQARAIAVTGNDDVIFGHQLTGPIDTKEGPGFGDTKDRMEMGTIGLISSSGVLEWMLPVDSTGFTNVRGAAGDAEGNVYFTGVIGGDATIGKTKIVNPFASAMFVAKYSNEGTAEWIRVMGNDEPNEGGEMIAFEDKIAVSGRNEGLDYNVYDEEGTLLTEDIHTVDGARGSRATLTIFSSTGDVVATYEPVATDVSNGGVLEYDGNGCIAFQQAFYGTIAYANGDSYTAANDAKKAQPDKDATLSYVCGLK
jgi:hypothetical protein